MCDDDAYDGTGRDTNDSGWRRLGSLQFSPLSHLQQWEEAKQAFEGDIGYRQDAVGTKLELSYKILLSIIFRTLLFKCVQTLACAWPSDAQSEFIHCFRPREIHMLRVCRSRDHSC